MDLCFGHLVCNAADFIAQLALSVGFQSSPVSMLTYLYHCGFFLVLPYFLAGSSFPCILPAPALESVLSPWSPGSFYWKGFRNPDLEL